MTEQTLARARAGDEDAFRELTDPYRRELQLHVYRIVGSAQDAEDLLQETLLAAWRGLERFEGRASVRAWLYRIATNRSLDALRASRRRPEDLQRMTEPPEPTAPGRADLARAVSRRPARGHPGPTLPDRRRATRPRRRSRWRSSSAFSTSRRSSARCSCCATCSASARRRSPRCSTPPPPRSTACCAARVRRSSRACPPPDANAHRSRLQARARRRRPLRRRRRGGRRRRHRRPAHRRRLADHAARAVGIPGPRRDRRVPARPRGPARRAAAAGADACERPARVRVLPARPKPASPGRAGCSSSRSRATGSPRSPGSRPPACSPSSDSASTAVAVGDVRLSDPLVDADVYGVAGLLAVARSDRKPVGAIALRHQSALERLAIDLPTASCTSPRGCRRARPTSSITTQVQAPGLSPLWSWASNSLTTGPSDLPGLTQTESSRNLGSPPYPVAAPSESV